MTLWIPYRSCAGKPRNREILRQQKNRKSSLKRRLSGSNQLTRRLFMYRYMIRSMYTARGGTLPIPLIIGIILPERLSPAELSVLVLVFLLALVYPHGAG